MRRERGVDDGTLVSAVIRPAAVADIAAIRTIYATYVETSTATFEETVPTRAEMADRWRVIVERGLPFVVAEAADGVAGYAYAAPFRQRSAYRFTLEDSIYIRTDAAGQGLGGRLLRAVIAACEAQDYRQMIAVIGDSANLASIRLHAALGFQHAGVLTAAGFKFERWIDSVYMQRALGEGDGNIPAG